MSDIDTLSSKYWRSILKQRPDLAIEDADGELIILDKTAGKVHQLNLTASFVWNCMSEGLAIDEIARKLAEAFDIEQESALSDVRAAIVSFKDLALVIE
jgi:hypothetical protein